MKKKLLLYLLGKSSSGWQRTSSTGIAPLHGSHATAPIACDGFTPEHAYHARTVDGREYHCHYCLLWPYRELPGTYSRLFIALHRRNKSTSSYHFLRFLHFVSVAHHGAVAKVAYAHYNSNRFVLDDWIFGYQGAPHLLTEWEMGEELSVVPHPFPQ